MRNLLIHVHEMASELPTRRLHMKDTENLSLVVLHIRLDNHFVCSRHCQFHPLHGAKRNSRRAKIRNDVFKISTLVR